jgi:hypothetical protein
MWCTSGTCSPRTNGVATMAGVDVNLPRAKASTAAIKCLSCATEHRSPAGGGIEVTTGGRLRKSGSNGALGALGTCLVDVGTPLFAWGALFCVYRAHCAYFKIYIRDMSKKIFFKKNRTKPPYLWPCGPFFFRLGLALFLPTPNGSKNATKLRKCAHIFSTCGPLPPLLLFCAA